MFPLSALRPARVLVVPHSVQSRNAVSVAPSKIYELRPVPRKYPERKSFLYNQYLKLLKDSGSSPILFLQHNDFAVPRLQKLRRDIVDAANRFAPPPAAPPRKGKANTLATQAKPSLTIVRATVLGVAIRDYKPLNEKASQEIAARVNGGLAVLTLPSLSPPQLHAVLRTLDRSVPPRPPKSEEELQKELEEKKADPVSPGRRIKKVKPTLVPELTLAGALIEGRAFTKEGLVEVAKLPTLETLRLQILGLLVSPGVRLAAALDEASGGQLHRTLRGLEKSLEEEHGATEAP